jgi:hypothetical protein
MLIFSMLYLLKAATQPLQMEHVLDQQGYVMPGIFKTQTPSSNFIGFSKISDQIQAKQEAKKLAELLNQYLANPVKKTTTLTQPFGKFSVSSYEFIREGCIVHHIGPNRQIFTSYVPTSQTSWSKLQETIDTELQDYMDGYLAAYLTPPLEKTVLSASPLDPCRALSHERQEEIKQWANPFLDQFVTINTVFSCLPQSKRTPLDEEKKLEEIKKGWSSSIVKQFSDSSELLFLYAYVYQLKIQEDKTVCVGFQLGTTEFCTDKCKALGYLATVISTIIENQNSTRNIQKKKACSSADYILSKHAVYVPPEDNQRIREAYRDMTLGDRYQKLLEFYREQCNVPSVFLKNMSGFGGWGANNCFFTALSGHPRLLQELINLLWENSPPDLYKNIENISHNESSKIETSYKNLGQELREKLFEYLRKNKQKVVYTEQGANRNLEPSLERITIEAFISKVVHGDLSFESYCEAEGRSGNMLPTELYDLLSILLQRRTVSVQAAPGSDFVNINGVLLDQMKTDGSFRWRQYAPPVYVRTSHPSHHYATQVVS